MDEKLKKHAKKSSFLCLCYILRAIRAGRCRERHILQNAPFRSQIFNIFFASGGKGALTFLTKILLTFLGWRVKTHRVDAPCITWIICLLIYSIIIIVSSPTRFNFRLSQNAENKLVLLQFVTIYVKITLWAICFFKYFKLFCHWNGMRVSLCTKITQLMSWPIARLCIQYGNLGAVLLVGCSTGILLLHTAVCSVVSRANVTQRAWRWWGTSVLGSPESAAVISWSKWHRTGALALLVIDPCLVEFYDVQIFCCCCASLWSYGCSYATACKIFWGRNCHLALPYEQAKIESQVDLIAVQWVNRCG